MIFLFDEGLAEQSSCLKDQEHFHRSLTLCVCKRAGLLQPVYPREGHTVTKVVLLELFMVFEGELGFLQIFSVVLCVQL